MVEIQVFDGEVAELRRLQLELASVRGELAWALNELRAERARADSMETEFATAKQQVERLKAAIKLDAILPCACGCKTATDRAMAMLEKEIK